MLSPGFMAASVLGCLLAATAIGAVAAHQKASAELYRSVQAISHDPGSKGTIGNAETVAAQQKPGVRS